MIIVSVNLLLDASYRSIDPRLKESQVDQSMGSPRRSRARDIIETLQELILNNPLSQWWARRIRPSEPDPFRDLLTAGEGSLSNTVTKPIRRRDRRLRGMFNLPLVVGSLIVIGLAILYFFGPTLAPRSPYALIAVDIQGGAIQRPPLPPQPRFPWGTDLLGRDILSLVLVGAQQTLTLALLAMGARLMVGTLLGAVAGWWDGSWVERVISGSAEVIAAFPTLLLAMLLILALDIRKGMMPFVIAFCVVGWGETMQYVRSETIAMRPLPWIESARAVGATTPRILLRHLFPNLLPTLIAFSALEMGAVLMLLGELGFLNIFIGGGVFYGGVGFFADIPEWGSLLSDARRRAFASPWVAIYPAAAFFISILGFNLLGEGLRRLTDQGRFHAGLLFNRYMLVAALLIFFAVGWARDNIGPIATYKQQASIVDGKQALAQAENLSDPTFGNRALGSKGMRDAANYIADEFKVLGLQGGGEDLSYFQTDTRQYSVLDSPPLMSVIGGVDSLTYREDYAPYPANYQISGSGEGKVRIVLAADTEKDPSRDWQHFASALSSLDSEDDVLLLLDEADLSYALFAPHQAILIVTDQTHNIAREYSYSPRSAVSCGYPENNEQSPIFWITLETANRLLAESGENTDSLISRRGALGEEEIFTLLIPTEVSLSVSTQRDEQEIVNVIGHLPGSREDLNDELVLVLAPYDSPPIVPGQPPTPAANDNASGVALMLEIIRALNISDYNAHRSFLFVAYSGEGWVNSGWRAADHDVEQFLTARQGFASAFDIQSVVYLRGLGAGDGKGLIVSSAGGVRIAELLERSAKRMGVAASIEAEQLNLSLLYDYRAQFTGESEKYPTVRPHWQGWEETARTAQDMIEILSPDKLEQAGEAIALTLITLGRELEY